MKQTKRTLVSLLLVFAMLATCLVAFSVTGTAAGEADVWDGSTYTEPTKKDSDGTTLLLTNAAEFAWVTQNPASAIGSYRLTTDVDMGGKSPTTNTKINITVNKQQVYNPECLFSGTLDGDGHYVRNITDNGGYSVAGLFIDVSGTIKNLTVKESTFTANGSNLSAPFAARSLTGTLENCHTVDCVISGYSAGGLVATCNGTIRNCTVNATISTSSLSNLADHTLGGLCVSISSTSAVIENCTVDGTFTGTNVKAKSVVIGGLVGSMLVAGSGWTWAGLKNCVNNATITAIDTVITEKVDTDGDKQPDTPQDFPVTATGCVVGGLFGRFSCRRASGGWDRGCASLTITNCVNNGNITVTAANALGVGGLAGNSYEGVFTAIDCINNADIVAASIEHVGGLFGSTSYCTTDEYAKYINYGTNVFENCGQYGAITGAVNVGGAVGYTYKNTTLENVVLAGTIKSSTSDAEGALVGTVIGCQTVTTANDKTLADSTLAMTNVYSPLTAALYNTDTAATGTLNVTSTSVVTGNAFTSGTIADFVTALNAVATANSWHKWAAAAAPLYIVFKGDAVQVTLDGATLSLDDTMTLKLFVKASSVEGIKGEFSTIMVNDGTKDYEGKFNNETGNYVFEIAGLAAKDMGTTKTYKIKYTLNIDTANPITCSEGVEYSPLQYAINMYNKNKQDGKVVDANFAALLTSMVRYMDAAGATGAKSTFATKTEYTFDDAAAETAYTEIMKKATEYNIPADTMSLGAELTSGITLLVKPADGKTLTSVKIGTDALTIESAGTNTWRVNGLNPGDLYNELTFTITTEEGTTEVTYSVARYLNNYVGTAYETLAKATALYMDAFITYKTATN